MCEGSLLKDRQRAERGNWNNGHLSLRVHRALSWIKAAEDARLDDARFLFYWIALNAAYAKHMTHKTAIGEGQVHKNFFRKMVMLDTAGQIEKVLWETYSGPIRVLLDNKYVYSPFWNFHAGRGDKDWELKFKTSRKMAHIAFQKQYSVSLLSNLFGRIYVLRNQIVHGGATYQGKINRAQIRDCTALLKSLVPVFIRLMMDNPHEKWDRPSYPVVED